MIKGDFIYERNGAGTLNNTYIYADGDIIFKGHAGNDRLNGKFDFSGHIVSEKNIKFHINQGSPTNIAPPSYNGVPGSISNSKIRITSWQEIQP
jgi:hypothetical protein